MPYRTNQLVKVGGHPFLWYLYESCWLTLFCQKLVAKPSTDDH